jgi:hypothetical protein
MPIMKALKAQRLETKATIKRWEETAIVDFALGDQTSAISIYAKAQKRLIKIEAEIARRKKQ